MSSKRQAQKGFLIIQSLVIIFVLSAVAGMLLTISTSGTKREQTRSYKFKSREIAEAGLDLSLNALRQATDEVDNDGDGLVDEGKDDPDWFAPSTVTKLEGHLGRLGTVQWSLADDANGNGLPDFGESDVLPVAFSGGQILTYSIFSENDGLDNDADGTVDEMDEAGSITIVAYSRYGDYDSRVRYKGIFTEKIVENPPTWSADKAFVAGGDLTVKGNCTITGTEGSIHCNGFMDLGGSSSIAKEATSSAGGDIDPDNVGGVVDTAAPEVPVPDVNQTNMLAVRDQAIADGKDVYYLNPDGSITLDGAVVSAGGTYHGWSLNNGEWTLSSTKADLDGLFFTESDVKLTGGKQGISMTVLAEGNITSSGNGDFTSYYSDLFLVSLKDIKLSGTPQQTGELGAILAREQVECTGNVFIRGVIVAADLDDVSSSVTSTLVEQNSISGNFGLEYNGGFTTQIPVYDPNSDKYRLDPVLAAYEER